MTQPTIQVGIMSDADRNPLVTLIFTEVVDGRTNRIVVHISDVGAENLGRMILGCADSIRKGQANE